jgi:hypothetical protein
MIAFFVVAAAGCGLMGSGDDGNSPPPDGDRTVTAVEGNRYA